MLNYFEKINLTQFNEDFDGMEIDYEEIKLPKRATKNSAGYDIYSPCDITMKDGDIVKFPTGIKVNLEPDKYLMIVPRSGLGFKFRLQLNNTCGIIDADYASSDNDGHIWMKLINDNREGKILAIKKGDAIAQGIICKYYTVDNDDATEIRNGGFGSTSK